MSRARLAGRMFVLGAALVVAMNADAEARTRRRMKLEDLPRGISAWKYSYDKDVARLMAEFNAKASPHLRFRYLFPYAGSLDFDAKARTAKLYYDPKPVASYARSLPKGTLLFPIVDARADKGEFSGWTDAEYRTVAVQVANAIANDRNAVGVQIDIEPFRPDHLPFYRHLKAELNGKGKFTTMFVGAKSEQLLTQISEACDIVVLSGYDVNGEGTPLEEYRKALRGGVARLQKVSAKTKRRFMVGIPAAASWGEYEYVVDKGGANRKSTGVKQEEYVRAAVDVLKDYEGSAEYIGASLWQLGLGETDRPELATKRTKYPNYIRPSVWKILMDY